MNGKKKAHLEAAKAIADKAAAESRGFTGEEWAQVQYHLDQAKQLDKGETPDEDPVTKQVLELNALFEGTNVRSTPGSGAKAGSWAAAFEKELQRRGAKALMEPTGAIGVPGVIAGLAPLGDRVETILQLIPWTRVVNTDAISYLQEVERTHKAAPVADGDRKPTSVYTLERIDDRVRTIAHLSEAIPRRYLADVALLRDYIRMVLREGYELELEYQILSGSGLLEEFTGVLNTAGIQLVPFDTDLFTTTRRAITALEVLSIAPGGYVFHPEDWEAFELTTGAEGQFLLKDGTNVVPIDRAKRRLWGYPVALSLGITEGTGLLVDWEGSTQGWERQECRIDWSESFHVPADAYDDKDSSGFERNLVKFRAEGRAFFALKRPRGAVEIELTTGS